MDQSRMQSNNDIQTRPNLGCDNESINNRENNQNYFSRNIIKKILLGTAFIAAGTYFVSNPSDMSKTVDHLEREANIAYEVFPVTEGLAWAGAIMMMASAGKRIGNPLTVKKRLAEVKDDLSKNKMFNIGWTLGAIGAIGTSATISIGSVVTLPESSWPLAFGASAASLAFSTIPFKPNNNKEESL